MSQSEYPQGAPGDPKAQPASYSILKFIVIFLGILLILGFAVLVGTIVYRLVNSEPKEAPGVVTTAAEKTAVTALLSEIELALPAGSQITGHDLDGARLAIRLQTAAGTEIWIVDLTSGQVASRVKMKRP